MPELLIGKLYSFKPCFEQGASGYLSVFAGNDDIDCLRGGDAFMLLGSEESLPEEIGTEAIYTLKVLTGNGVSGLIVLYPSEVVRL